MSETIRLRTDSIGWRRLDDRVVVLDLLRSRYLVVAGTGEAIWQDLVDGTNADDLVRSLCASFDVDADVARQDVESFVAQLSEHGLLQTVHADGPPDGTDVPVD